MWLPGEDIGWSGCAFLYLHAAFQGIKGKRIPRHLVIDEMQDYTVQYAVFASYVSMPENHLGITDST